MRADEPMPLMANINQQSNMVKLSKKSKELDGIRNKVDQLIMQSTPRY